MFVDACHSGSALTEAKKWALKYSGRGVVGKTEGSFSVDYFNEKVRLDL